MSLRRQYAIPDCACAETSNSGASLCGLNPRPKLLDLLANTMMAESIGANVTLAGTSSSDKGSAFGFRCRLDTRGPIPCPGFQPIRFSSRAPIDSEVGMMRSSIMASERTPRTLCRPHEKKGKEVNHSFQSEVAAMEKRGIPDQRLLIHIA